VAIGSNRLRGTALAMLCHQRRIDDVPLRLQDAPEDGVARLLRDGFEVVQGRGGFEGSDVSGGQIEGGKFGHLVSGRVVDPADQYTDMAHGKLLRQSVVHIRPYLRAIRMMAQFVKTLFGLHFRAFTTAND
jgi:hypothetical protein